MKPTKEHLSKINKFTHAPLGEEEVAVHQFLVGNTNVTAYKTIFDVRTLRKFAVDLMKGQTAMSIHHATRSVMPPGRSFDGRIDSNSKANVYGMFYVPTALDEYKVSARIDAGTIFDVSMGVQVSRYECTICHNDWRSPKCSHWPGQSYNVGTDEKPKMKEAMLLMMGTKVVQGPFGEMFDDCSLSETSVVTDGAVPGAGVVKGAFCNEETMEFCFGNTKLQKFQMTEGNDEPDFTKYAAPVVQITLSSEPEEVNDMADVTELLAKIEKFQAEVSEKLDTSKTQHETEVAALNTKITELGTQVTALETDKGTLDTENKALRAFCADMLLHYRTKLEGNGFDAAVAKEEFTKMSVEDMTKKLGDLREQITAKFGKGRTSPEEPADGEGKVETPVAFDHLFKV